MLPIIYDIDIIVASLATNSKTPNINNDSEVSIDDLNIFFINVLIFYPPRN